MLQLSLVALTLITANAPREATVRAPSFGSKDGARETPVRVRLSENRARVPSVGVSEELASGAADQWLTTLWQAAFVATQATGSSLLDYEFSLRVGGPIDGSSAGLLTASTLAALIKGKKILPHTTITGSINPDGSAGPVSAVLERLTAASAGGVKRFGVPLGARQQIDESGVAIDLLLEGKKLGVEVRELATLDDAFLFLTGVALSRPTPVSEVDMELWPVELAALSRLTAEVRREYDAELPQLDPKAGSRWLELLARSTQKAEDFAKNGDTVRAMVVWSSALTILRVAVQDTEAKDVKAVTALVERLESELPVARRELRAAIEKQFPNTTRTNDVYAMDLLESVLTQGLGQRGLPAEQDPQKFARLARAHAEELVRAREELRNGQRFLALYSALPPLKKSLPAIDAARLAPWYASAAAASQLSLKSRLAAQSERPSALEKDRTFAELVGYGELLTTETDARARLVLAARQTIYSDYLVNTYDALGAQLDARGVLSIRNARALSAQLDLARQRVLQSCGAAKRETGSIPFPARMRFLNARAAREGSDRQKTDALAELWISNWWCEFVVRDKR